MSIKWVENFIYQQGDSNFMSVIDLKARSDLLRKMH